MPTPTKPPAALHNRCETVKERAIDNAMNRARRLYESGTEAKDPHAMHKAVESLPVCVLVEYLRMKTKWDFLDDDPGSKGGT